MDLETIEEIDAEARAATELAAAELGAAAAWDEPEDEAEDTPGDGDGDGAPPEVGLPFAAILNPAELSLARSIVERLAPRDAQEEIHAWQLAVTHIFAAERVGKARQDGLPLRPQQIEMGLAVRIMALGDRKSAALDRHRELGQKAAERAEAAARQAEEAAEMSKPGSKVARALHEERCGFLVVPEEVSPEEWSREAKAHHRRLMNDEPEPEGHPEARERIVQERAAYAVQEALARGESEGSLTIPYPSEEEVAARAAADRKAKLWAEERGRAREAAGTPSAGPGCGPGASGAGGVPPAVPPGTGTERDP